MTGLNDFFAEHELSRVEVGFSATRGAYTAIRNSTKRLIKDNLFGEGDTPEAALADLAAKVKAVARQTPAPVVADPAPSDDLDDLLG